VALNAAPTAVLAESPTALTWWRADPRRLERERRMLRAPWRLTRDGERYRWSGGTLWASSAGVTAPERGVQLIYPTGYPARFIEVRLIPDPPTVQWGMLGTHVNLDGSVCFITGEGWTPQMTVRTALDLANDWWFNYWVIVEQDQWFLDWPDQGRITLSSGHRAALHHR
jgi:hypothetical protein